MFKMSNTGRGACVQKFMKVVNSFLSAASQICCSALSLAPEWSNWALSKVCEMPEALHPTMVVK